MATRAVEMSPVNDALFRRSTLSLAVMFPSTLPCTITLRASRFARTWPFGPIVKLWPRSEIEPSTEPSTYRSSLPDNSPFTTTDLPMVATSTARGDSTRVGSAGLVAGEAGGCIVLGAFRSGIVNSSSLRVDFHMGYGSVTYAKRPSRCYEDTSCVPYCSQEDTEVMRHGQLFSTPWVNPRRVYVATSQGFLCGCHCGFARPERTLGRSPYNGMFHRSPAAAFPSRGELPDSRTTSSARTAGFRPPSGKQIHRQIGR